MKILLIFEKSFFSFEIETEIFFDVTSEKVIYVPAIVSATHGILLIWQHTHAG